MAATKEENKELIKNKKSEDAKAKRAMRILENKWEELQNRQYSIYNYFKEKPSALIALFSASVAVITYFLRLAAANNMKSILSFWSFNLSYVNYTDSSLFVSLFSSFIYLILIGLAVSWYRAHNESTLVKRKFLYENKLFIKRLRKEKKNLQEIEKFETIVKKEKSLYYMSNTFATLILWMITFLGIYVYESVKSKAYDFNFFKLVFFYSIFQLFVLRILSLISNKELTSKRKLKKKFESEPLNSLKDSINKALNDNNHASSIAVNGIRSFFSNASILACAVLIALNLILTCFVPFKNIKQRNWKNDTYRIITLDKTKYAIILQDNNRYYLEKAEIVVLKEDDGTNNATDKIAESNAKQKPAQEKTILNIYLNEQRVVVLNDISYVQQTFDDIVKIESGDANK